MGVPHWPYWRKYSLGGTCAIAYVGYKNGPQVEFFQK